MIHNIYTPNKQTNQLSPSIFLFFFIFFHKRQNKTLIGISVVNLRNMGVRVPTQQFGEKNNQIKGDAATVLHLHVSIVLDSRSNLMAEKI